MFETIISTNIQIWQWGLLIAISILLFVVSPIAQSSNDFFKGTKNQKEPNVVLLTSSLVISWLFAKSITNAADLGFSFGMLGGLAYAAYYVSFIVAGFIIYQLRVSGGYSSIHQFLLTKYGKTATGLFSLLIVFRLFNEVWSNSMVIGSYFGAAGSATYYGAIGVFTALTLAYTIKGGMRSSLLTDLIQMGLFVVLLTLILGFILPATPSGMVGLITEGSWTIDQGGNLLLVALLQSISYPFHDPVMTDRGFITKPKATLKAFIWAAFIGALAIMLFSWVGVFGRISGSISPVVPEVARLFGVPMLLMVNLIMVTSAASTIDSTLTSATKLFHSDVLQQRQPKVSAGRLTMVAVTILGTIPIFFNPAILSATTISGTMVLGLAPVFLLWKLPAPRASYFLSVIAGLLAGLWLIFVPISDSYLISFGKYADLLTVNIIGTVLAFLGFLIPYWIKKKA